MESCQETHITQYCVYIQYIKFVEILAIPYIACKPRSMYQSIELLNVTSIIFKSKNLNAILYFNM